VSDQSPIDYSKPVPFAPNDRIEALRPFVEEFWDAILGTSYSTSYVSNFSRFSSWEHYVGGREALIARVRAVYGVDISHYYDGLIADILIRIRDRLT